MTPPRNRKRREDEGHPVPPVALLYTHIGSHFSNSGQSPIGVELTRSLLPWARARVLASKS